MALLQLNGIEIPCKVGSASRSVVYMGGGIDRAFSGQARTTYRARKREWRFKTKPIGRDDLHAYETLIEGRGINIPLNYGPNSTAGLKPVSHWATHTVYSGGTSGGQPGGLGYCTTNIPNEGFTHAWRTEGNRPWNAGTIALFKRPSGQAWLHEICRVKNVHGTRTVNISINNSPWGTGDDGLAIDVFSYNGDTNNTIGLWSKPGDSWSCLVYLPCFCPDEWVSQIYGWMNGGNNWSWLPRLTMTGNVQPSNAVWDVRGEIAGVELMPFQAGSGAVSTVGVIDFVLKES